MRHLLTILILFFATSAFDCNKSDPSAPDLGSEGDTVYDADVVHEEKGRTPKGVRVSSRKSVSPQEMSDIDSGMSWTFGLIEKEYPTRVFTKHDNYRVSVFQHNPLCIEKGFIVKGYRWSPDDWLDQSVFDKDRRPNYIAVCAAGKMGTITDNGNVDYYLSLVRGNLWTAAKYEAEHSALLDVDPDRYMATIASHYHPILAQPEGFAEYNKQAKTYYAKIPKDAKIPKGFTEKPGDEICLLIVK